MPCERLFSAGAEVATDRRSRLGAERFEELQVMKHAWRKNVVNQAAFNSAEIFLEEFRELQQMDEEFADLEGRDEHVVVL